MDHIHQKGPFSAGASVEGPRPAGKTPVAPVRGLVGDALLISADVTHREMWRKVLESEGLHVEEADSGVAAVVAARSIAPVVLCIDLQLRDVPGLLAIDWLRSNPALGTTPIIVTYASATERSNLATLSHVIAVPKPASPETIRNAVVKALGRKQSAAHLEQGGTRSK
ncbi:MAG TPA: response regulator [Candidatus Cybelea sp.]|nr:response regulator [Candidatus Cybelea sp.]